jgi:hypothetical protein
MKYFFITAFVFVICSEAKTQPFTYPFYQLYQLDSIGRSPSFTRHFGGLYFQFLQLVESRLNDTDTVTQRLVRHFEMVFADFYIDACKAYRDQKQISLPAWRTYFSDSTLQPVQYKLLGTNAHLNGGLAEAIYNSYTPGEWKQLKKKYVLFNKCLNTTFKNLYHEAVNTNRPANLLHELSFGLSKTAGRYYLYKWRKRQMRVTEYSFLQSDRYSKLLDKINRKKDKIDRLVITLL